MSLALVAGCSPRATEVTITNASSGTLSNLVVSCTGDSYRIEALAAGASVRRGLRASSESDVRIAFDAVGRTISTSIGVYLEPASGGSIDITIDPKLGVTARQQP
ncbi:MAG: hypothetical protein H0X17_00045 [Deltaproteobacteria bacterium]|nr:hypothetical protein [Deltaproteobacteria bacterium]